MFFRRGRRLVCVVVSLLGAAKVDSAPTYTCDNHLVILSNTTAGCDFSPQMAVEPADEGTEIIQTHLNAVVRSNAFFCAPDYRPFVIAGCLN